VQVRRAGRARVAEGTQALAGLHPVADIDRHAAVSVAPGKVVKVIKDLPDQVPLERRRRPDSRRR
jgi:hypothetical protein